MFSFRCWSRPTEIEAAPAAAASVDPQTLGRLNSMIERMALEAIIKIVLI